MSAITTVSGKAVTVAGNDIDTDRIIPAKFMKCVTFDDLAEGMFYDVKVDPNTGKKTEHPLNDPKHAEASIILTGENFGCGSSREHAPQSIFRNGFRAIVAESFAEIFFGNSTTLGMPCVCASREDIAELVTYVDQNPDAEISIDLQALTISYGDSTVEITMPSSAQTALTSGKFDPLSELIENMPAIEKTAEALPYV